MKIHEENINCIEIANSNGKRRVPYHENSSQQQVEWVHVNRTAKYYTLRQYGGDGWMSKHGI